MDNVDDKLKTLENDSKNASARMKLFNERLDLVENPTKIEGLATLEKELKEATSKLNEVQNAVIKGT